MRNLRLEKKGLRGLAIAESFKQNSKYSVLAGIVMRRDFLIDGFVFGKTTIGGTDATDEIIRMYQRLNRPDVSYLLISGLIISLYNIVDIQKIYKSIAIPVIAITYHNSKGITNAIKSHFLHPQERLSQYDRLKKRKKIHLKTSFDLYVRCEGCTHLQAKHLLDSLTIHGSRPEPIRVAHLLARSLLH